MRHLISIIVPTLDEKDNVLRVIELVRSINSKTVNLEIIFVDDMSTDGTSQLILENTCNSISLITSPKRLGLGNALNLGVEASKSDYILFLDCDCSVSTDDLKKLIASRQPDTMVIGSRYLKESKVIGAPKIKVFLSRFLNFIVAKYLSLNVSDLSHSLRVFPRKMNVPKDLLSHPGYFWSFCLDIRLSGYEIKEIPITFNERKAGHTKNTTRKMLKSVLRSLKHIKNRSKK